MRIERFDAHAYGQFTNQSLDLQESGKLHIILGPNEAGKTTLLRGLGAALFGIPGQCRDVFKHKSPRVGARLRLSSGVAVEFTRAKGKNALRRSDESAISEQEFTQWLGGVSLDLFDTVFGLDHEKLTIGGRQLIAGQGDVALLLFESAGFLNVQAVLDELENEADAIFAPAAHKRELNLKLREIKDFQREIREKVLRPDEYLDKARRLTEIEAAIDGLLQQKENRNKALVRLRRVQENSCDLAERQQLNETIAALGDVPDLSPTFSEERVRLFTGKDDTLAAIENGEDQLARKRKTLSSLPRPCGLRVHGDRIETLAQGLGNYRKQTSDRKKLQERSNTARGEASAKWAELVADEPIENIQQYSWRESTTRQLRTLLQQSAALRERNRVSQQSLTKLKRSLISTRATLNETSVPPDVSSLAQLLDSLEASSNQTRLEELQAEALTLATARERAIAALPWWKGSEEDLHAFSVPPEETIREYEKQYETAAENVMSLREELQERQGQRIQLCRDIERLRLEREVPTDEQLAAERAARDRGWLLIRRFAFTGDLNREQAQAQYEPPVALDEAFEKHVRATDILADHLRSDAHRVVEFRTKQKQTQECEEDEKRLAEGIEAAERNMRDIAERWRREWPEGLLDLHSPAEMHAWLGKRDNVLKATSDATAKQVAFDLQRKKVEEARQRLSQMLAELGEPEANESENLIVLARRARDVVDTYRAAKIRREQVAKEVEDIQLRMSDTEADNQEHASLMEAWTERWRLALEAVNLPSDMDEQEIGALLDGIPRVREAWNEWQESERRLQGIVSEMEAYEAEVRSAVDELSPELSSVPADLAIERLASKLKEDLGAERERERIERDIQTLEADIERCKEKLENTVTAINKLCSSAGEVAPEELPIVEERVRRKREILSRVDQIETALRRRNAGMALDGVVTESMATSIDELNAEIIRLENEEKDSQQQVVANVEERTTVRAAIQTMETAAGTAELQQSLQIKLAEARELAERRAVLQLQTELIKHALERYRKRNERPTLEKAGLIFSNLTARRFVGLEPEFDGDKKVIKAKRVDGVQLGVEALSDGTADQLFLALRLAAIENYVRQSGEFPCVFDDILVNFDDYRASAALEELASLSEKTQVLLFTHHEHVAHLAEQVVPSRYILHKLGFKTVEADKSNLSNA